MSSPDDVFRQMEGDRSVREREIRLVGNVARKAASQPEREMLFRTSVLLTYAHLEGFCKFALTAYVSAINALNLSCNEASHAIAAASLTELFGALRHPQTKHEFFANELPEDAKLHLMAREREFMANYTAAMRMPIRLAETVVDTESNLKPVVLMKNLFKLGLNYKAVEPHKSSISKLLGVRNAIAHGDILKVPKSEEIDEYVASAFGVMSFVQNEVYTALIRGTYRATPPQAN